MSSEGSERAACIFCGATDQKMTKEHVWPEWMRKLLPPEAAEAGHTYSFEDRERGEYRRLEGLPPVALKIRDVCEPCNTGWMHRTEDDAELPMPRLLAGQTGLSEFEQAKLAFWGILKGLVAVRAGDGQSKAAGFPPTEDYREIHECGQSRMPPDGFLVHIAGAGWSVKQAPVGFTRLTGISRPDRQERDEFDGYAITFSALDLVVQVIRVFGIEPTKLIPFDDPRFGRAIRRIWPIQPGGVDWPPDDTLTWAGLEALSGGPIRPNHA